MIERLQRFWRGVSYVVLGQWNLIYTEPLHSAEELLMAIEIETEGLNICCEEITYTVHYKRRWIPDRVYTVFKFTARPLGTSSKILRLATVESVYFPPIGERLYGKNNAKQHMMRLFIEVIIQRAYRIRDEVGHTVL